MFDTLIFTYLDDDTRAKILADEMIDNPQSRKRRKATPISREAAKSRHSLARKKAARKRKYPVIMFHRAALEYELTHEYTVKKTSYKSISAGLKDYAEEIEDEVAELEAEMDLINKLAM